MHAERRNGRGGLETYRLAGVNCSMDSNKAIASGVAALYFDVKPLPPTGFAAVQSPNIFRSTAL